MVLKQLKQIRDELKNSADNYDLAFKKTALIAAQELSEQEINISGEQHQDGLNNRNLKAVTLSSKNSLDKEYFVEKYGSLKNAKLAYQKKYGQQQYGRRWSEFILAAQKLSDSDFQTLSLEDRIARIENFLVSLGYQL